MIGMNEFIHLPHKTRVSRTLISYISNNSISTYATTKCLRVHLVGGILAWENKSYARLPYLVRKEDERDGTINVGSHAYFTEREGKRNAIKGVVFFFFPTPDY